MNYFGVSPCLQALVDVAVPDYRDRRNLERFVYPGMVGELNIGDFDADQIRQIEFYSRYWPSVLVSAQDLHAGVRVFCAYPRRRPLWRWSPIRAHGPVEIDASLTDVPVWQMAVTMKDSALQKPLGEQLLRDTRAASPATQTEPASHARSENDPLSTIHEQQLHRSGLCDGPGAADSARLDGLVLIQKLSANPHTYIPLTQSRRFVVAIDPRDLPARTVLVAQPAWPATPPRAGLADDSHRLGLRHDGGATDLRCHQADA